MVIGRHDIAGKQGLWKGKEKNIVNGGVVELLGCYHYFNNEGVGRKEKNTINGGVIVLQGSLLL